MAIPDYARRNFETLLKAAEAGDLALMECTEVETGEIRFVLCAVGRNDGDYVMTPFGHLAPATPTKQTSRPPERWPLRLSPLNQRTIP